MTRISDERLAEIEPEFERHINRCAAFDRDLEEEFIMGQELLAALKAERQEVKRQQDMYLERTNFNTRIINDRIEAIERAEAAETTIDRVRGWWRSGWVHGLRTSWKCWVTTSALNALAAEK